MKRLVTPVLVLALAALMSACSSQPSGKPASQAAAKPPEYLAARSAFQQLFVSARSWAGDVRPFQLQSQFTPDAPTNQGQAGLWRGSFASPAKRSMKLFVWSGLSGPDAPDRGVSFSPEDSWNPSNPSTVVFDPAFLKVDSDKAYDVAQQHGGEKLTKADPKQPVFFMLDWKPSEAKLIWHVIYGSSQDEAKLRVAVDATTGEFLRLEK
jgi:hypothetical protein